MSADRQGELPIAPIRRLFVCSPTKLMTWVDCPRRYRFTYLDRPSPAKGAPWAHLSYGSSVHNALRAWWDLPKAERTPSAAAELVGTSWLEDGYRDSLQRDEWKRRAATQVVTYVGTVDSNSEPLGLERTVALKTEGMAFSGRVDRIDERSGNAVVVDYKVGRSVPDASDARSSIALALYAEATSKTLRKSCRRVELHHLPSGTVAAWDHTDASVTRQVQRAESIAAEAALTIESAAGRDHDEAFPAKPGSLCGWCEFRLHCPEGQQAGPARQPWDGLPD